MSGVKIDDIPAEDWASAVAVRIADEWGHDQQTDRQLLCDVLEKAFLRCPDLLPLLIGTEIIEDDYFTDLDQPAGKSGEPDEK